MDNKEFWDSIILNKDWTPNMENIYKELIDFGIVVNHCETIYSHITSGMISKCMTYPDEVIRIYEENNLDLDITKSDMKDMLELWEEDLRIQLKEYFQLKEYE